MTKLLVFIWGQLTIFPLLAPFVIFGALWALHRLFLRDLLKNVNAALVFFAGVTIAVTATYTLWTSGPDLYADFLEKRGVEVDARVVAISHTLVIPQFENRDQVKVTFLKNDGVEKSVIHQSEPRRFYPPIEGTIPPPKVGDRLRIRYFPGAEDSFLVLTDPEKSRYGATLLCERQKYEYEVLGKRYRHADFPPAELKAEFRAIMEARLRSHCLSMTEREDLRKELESVH